VLKTEPPERAWTVMVYMAADNELDTAAIADLTEMESVDWNSSTLTVLVLLDRAQGAAWSGTRLYKVENGGVERLSFPALDLSTDSETELNMSDPLVLEKFLAYGKANYKADNYALIMWGHGTGWRYSGAAQSRAVAIDDTSGTYMALPDLGNAIAAEGHFGFIGFDLCFGATLEEVYQLRNDADYFAGSAGLTPSAGWDYEAFFDDFIAKEKDVQTPEAFAKSALDTFKTTYSGTDGAGISVIKLDKVSSLFSAFDAYAGSIAAYISTDVIQTAVYNNVFNGAIKRYYASGETSSDYYIDIASFADTLNSASSSAALKAALNEAIPYSWSKSDGENNRELGVFAGDVTYSGGTYIPSATFPALYTHGSETFGKSAFVNDSQHWPPYSGTPNAGSFLDKVLKWSY
jgi:hypothetical protein